MTQVIYHYFPFDWFFVLLSSLYIPVPINKSPHLLQVASFSWVSVCTTLRSLPTHPQNYLFLSFSTTTTKWHSWIFWTRTCSPHKIAYIVTSVNFPSLSDSSATVFLYFVGTNNVSRYLVTPFFTEALYDYHLYTHPPNTVLRHTLQHLLKFTYLLPMYAEKSFQNSLPKNGIPTYVISYIHITSLSRISWIPDSFNLSHTCLTPPV